MEILDQLQAKVRNAVQKIEELQAKVNELEAVKRQYEEKMQSMVQEIGDVSESSGGQTSAEDSESDQPGGNPSQESVYRHQF